MEKIHSFATIEEGSTKKKNVSTQVKQNDEVIFRDGQFATMYDYKQFRYKDRMNEKLATRSKYLTYVTYGPLLLRDNINDTTKIYPNLFTEDQSIRQNLLENYYDKKKNKIDRVGEFGVQYRNKKNSITIKVYGSVNSDKQIEKIDYPLELNGAQDILLLYHYKIPKDGLDNMDRLLSKSQQENLKNICNNDSLYCVVRLIGIQGGYDPLNPTMKNIMFMQRIYYQRKFANRLFDVGCLVTCMADVISYYGYNGKRNITPLDVDRTMDEMDESAGGDETKRGHLLGNAGMATYNVAKKYGLKYEPYPQKLPVGWDTKKLYETEWQDSFKKMIDNRLKENKPTIVMLKNKNSDGGHYVVIVGIRYDPAYNPKYYIINEPELKERDYPPELDDKDLGLIDYNTLCEMKGMDRPIYRLHFVDK